MSGKTEVRKVRNMTEGNPAKLIFFFAIPLMLGNLFTHGAYDFCDDYFIDLVWS